MALTAQISASQNEVPLNGVIPVALVFTNDSSTEEVVVSNINFTTNQVGTLISTISTFSPVSFTEVSGGVPVTSSVANPQAPNSSEITYFPFNISGAVQIITDYAGTVETIIPSGTLTSSNAQPAVGFLVYGSGANDATFMPDSSYSGSTPDGGAVSGDTKIKTSPSKFGTSGSILFDGTGDYVSYTPNGGNQSVTNLSGTGNSTVECYFYSNNNTTYQPLISQGITSTVWALFVSGTEVKMSGSDASFLNIGGQGGGQVTSSATTINTGVWNHLAAVKSGSFYSFYLNGTRLNEFGVTTGYSSSAGQGRITLGAEKETSPSQFFSGSITNARISNIAQYSGASFTTSSVPFTDPTIFGVDPAELVIPRFLYAYNEQSPTAYINGVTIEVGATYFEGTGSLTPKIATPENVGINIININESIPDQIQVSVSPSAGRVIDRSLFSRPPEYATSSSAGDEGFDFICSAVVNLPVTPFASFFGTTNPTTEFSSSNPAVIEVQPTGAFGSITGSLGNPQLTKGAGACTIKGTGTAVISFGFLPSISGSTTIQVVDNPVVAIQVTPEVGQITYRGSDRNTVQLKAIGLNANGTTTDLTSTVTWASSDGLTTVVNGLVTSTTETPLFQRQAIISATYQGRVASAVITIIPDPTA